MSTSKSTPSVGLIGVGLMGLGIATNLQRHGYQLHLLDHPGNQPLDQLLAQGALSFTTPAQLAAVSPVIILCVTGSPQVEEVLFGADGVIQALQPGTVIIDCSTSIPASTLHNAQRIGEAGGSFLDAPMTRTPKEAMQGRLNLIVGGEREVFEAQLALLQCFAENITYAGGVSNGHTLKLLHNFVSLGFTALLSEAAACASKAGVDESVFVEVLANGGGGGVILERLKPFILDADDTAFSFSIGNAIKDLDYYRSMSDDVQAANQAAVTILQMLQQAGKTMESSTPIPHLIEALQSD